jgi:hypothetical protein
MHETVATVIEELDAHRERFEAFCRSLSEEELTRSVPRSTWLVGDFIAHLATIDGPVGEMFRSVHAGEDPGIRTGDGQRFDVDGWNEGRIQERRVRTVEDLLAEAAGARAALKVHLSALTAEDLAKSLKFQGDSKRRPAEWPLESYLRGWCKHDPMHALDMSRALPEQMTPELEQWFADPVVRGYQRAMNPDNE